MIAVAPIVDRFGLRDVLSLWPREPLIRGRGAILPVGVRARYVLLIRL
ncbi:MAG TPA: hypothetical protein VHG10_08550 [Glycomyces sp.]|nr:hypothetical protein [Glycomyces sp.]